jgi:uncharacterized coiled-coil DUF342 family protein
MKKFRQGWNKAFKLMHNCGDDKLIDVSELEKKIETLYKIIDQKNDLIDSLMSRLVNFANEVDEAYKNIDEKDDLIRKYQNYLYKLAAGKVGISEFDKI